tara:strand:+ start:7269 stop:8870 length:1602 start_codon:yes stop_codon:yes gene_type:complete
MLTRYSFTLINVLTLFFCSFWAHGSSSHIATLHPHLLTLEQYQKLKPDFELPKSYDFCYNIDEDTCFFAKVPKNYQQPDTEFVYIFFYYRRARTVDPYKGLLLFHYDELGNSSADMFFYASSQLSQTLIDQFDLIAIEPRGSGLSAFASEVEDCLGQAPCDMYPLSFISTETAVKDLELIRQYLQTPKLNLWSYSDDARITSLYATQYPQHTRAVIMDSPISPYDISAQSLYKQIEESRIAYMQLFLDQFSDLKQQFPRYHNLKLLRDPNIQDEDLIQKNQRLLKDLNYSLKLIFDAYDPESFIQFIQDYDPHVIDEHTLKQHMQQFHYFYMPSHINLMTHYFVRSHTAATPESRKHQIYKNEKKRKKLRQLLWCETSQADQFAQHKHPFSTILLNSETNLDCRAWYTKTQKKIPKIGNSSSKVLIIGNSHDPFTPYAWALDMHHAFKASILLTLEQSVMHDYSFMPQDEIAHTIQKMITAYLLNPDAFDIPYISKHKSIRLDISNSPTVTQRLPLLKGVWQKVMQHHHNNHN